MQKLRNSKTGYGLVTRALHWGMAIAIFAMFGLGLWMSDLGLYHPWYHAAPHLHKSIGIVLLALLGLRLLWRLWQIRPDDSYLKRLEQVASRLTHWAFYGLLFLQMISGYLISTLGGKSIEVFQLFEIPSLISAKDYVETVALVHEYLAYTIIGLAIVHTFAALKHHFFDRDETLKRMISSNNPQPLQTQKRKIL